MPALIDLDIAGAAGFHLHYPPQDEASAALVAKACQRSLPVIRKLWQIPAPQDCHITLMTGWLSYLFQTAPWCYKLLYAATFFFWVGQVQRVWSGVGGWTSVLGSRVLIGIKPARLLEKSDSSLGGIIFRKAGSLEQKMAIITAHELTHAHTLPLKLPTWLNEGLAMLTCDRLLGITTVREETLEALATADGLVSYPALTIPFIRGYWLTRYLLEVQPGLLRELLAQPVSRPDLERRIAAALGIQAQSFWREAGPLAAQYFLQRAPAGETI